MIYLPITASTVVPSSFTAEYPFLSPTKLTGLRPLRAQTVELATDDDIARLTEIEQQAAALRTEYRLLNSTQ